MKKYKIGYTQGTFDMFHIGHLNLLNNAKKQCDYLIVGINSDILVEEYKKKKTVICEKERLEIVKNIKAVDEAVVVSTLDKKKAWDEYNFDAIFIGDDWKGNRRWMETEIELEKIGVKVCFLPHTRGVSSTVLRDMKHESIDE